ncbi:hypothetical protein GIY23_04465 [Allosaccharopolyspora coralli]|uniref:PQQ-binding-like beta-propeller repeat protein n=1 Tax=Allosaccharopolyspora coralli TaxID=2665642 RepID=A0A5Q3QC62_9PSEU|nr:hypothetical protein GIY23_04465 [Allosaccharopolyspora coralli]
MAGPERRTRADLVAVVVLVVAAVVATTVVWVTSDARATLSEISPRIPAPEQPVAVPPELTEAWRAPSGATPEPVTAGPGVITGDGSTVRGHDPRTGEEQWRYARDLPLCTVGAEWRGAIAVHRKGDGCSEVTALEGATGTRGPQRNSDAELGTRLLSDGTYVTATGTGIVESWRSDLVRTQQYGVPAAPKNAGNNLPRPGCRTVSVGVGDDRVGLVEACPGEQSDRITVIKARPEDDEQPEQVLSVALGSADASIVAVSQQFVAAVLRDRGEVAVYDTDGNRRQSFPARTEALPPDEVRVEATTPGEPLTWFTGRDTVALAPNSFTPLWTVPDTLGSGALFAGKLLVPVRNGLAVIDPRSGARETMIPVDRGGFDGPVEVAVLGDTVLEQRGDTLVALR